MEVTRFINGRPVGAVPPMKIANEGVLRIIREVQARPPEGRPAPGKDAGRPDLPPAAD